MQPQKTASIFSITFPVRKIFLLDGTGALVSFLSLGFLLPAFQPAIGMPLETLYLLAGFPLLFFIFDLSSYWANPVRTVRLIRIIAYANLSYCFISTFFLIWHASVLTWLGWAYFIGEVVLVAALAVWELRVATRLQQK